ncbi:MAG: hypothetical protein J6T88_04750 [Bacteroidales bacterium]|nr:hypothetical protein [Bacteroidales bacterium]
MNKKPDIEDLFEAARRREADLERQQKLSEMIDQLAAAETHQRRRPIWVYSGVAAGILLLVTVGLHILFGDVEGPKDGPIVAETHPVQPSVVSDTTPADSQNVADAAPVYAAPKRNAVFAEATPSLQPVEQPADIKGDGTENATHPALAGTPLREGTATQVEVPLLAESAVTVPPDTPQVAAAQHRVFERTSSRLVCGAGCKPEPKINTNGDAPQYAFLNIIGTSTSFELGNISF